MKTDAATEAYLRQNALEHATSLARMTSAASPNATDAEQIVKSAETFLAFLRGDQK